MEARSGKALLFREMLDAGATKKQARKVSDHLGRSVGQGMFRRGPERLDSGHHRLTGLPFVTLQIVLSNGATSSGKAATKALRLLQRQFPDVASLAEAGGGEWQPR